MSQGDTEGGSTERSLEEMRQGTFESIKMGFDSTKQLITLNAGSIVIIGTFLSDIFTPEKDATLVGPWYLAVLVGLAFVLFGSSLVVSVYALFVQQGLLNLYIMFRTDYFGLLGRAPWFTVVLPVGLFSLGVICFGVAVLLNLFFVS